MKQMSAKGYLELIAGHGDINGRELAQHVPRVRNDYRDFYPLAALLHSGFIETDSSTQRTGREKLQGAIGYTTQDSAAVLCQYTLKAGESFRVEDTLYEWSTDFPVQFFLTGAGYVQLARLREEAQRSRERLRDHLITLGIAVLAAIISAAATAMLTDKFKEQTPLVHTPPAAVQEPKAHDGVHAWQDRH